MRTALLLRVADAQDAILWWLHRCRRALRSLWLCRGRHTDELVMTPTRWFLSCTTCRRRTLGWDVRAERIR